ncbi:MAG: hypothetical protein Q8Q97_00130, partial [bacterium]|nr:hypothetical protein [bacterium]
MKAGFNALLLSAICMIALSPMALSLGSAPGLDWDNYSADRDALLANPALSEGQKELLETELDSLEYFNGEIESAEYDFLLLSDEKSEFTPQDLQEISASNEQTRSGIAQLRQTIAQTKFVDVQGGSGYARNLDNLGAAKSNI